MKYGILWRKTTKNIGDDMQSYAASVWLPSVDYQVDIEALDQFESEDDEPVATIMSAWYMWAKWNWPPSKYVYPCWIGLHYNDLLRHRGRGMPSKFEYLTGPGLEYLKKYEPIGCRDPYTQDRMNELGVKNYFSGCITLTLPRRDLPKPEREYVVLVDVGKEVEKAVRKQLEGTGIDVKVLAPTRKERSTNMSWEERKAQVEEYLATYQNAKCVLAFRLHCSLPCLALETPLLLVRPNFDSIRFQPYKDWMHKAYPEQVINGEFRDFMLNPPKNPDNYKPVREQLIKTVTEFVEQAKKETRKASELVRTTYTDLELMEWQNKTMKQTLANYLVESRIDLDTIIKQRRTIKKYKELFGDENAIDKMYVEYNCFAVRFALKVRAFYSNIVFALRRFKKRFKKNKKQ